MLHLECDFLSYPNTSPSVGATKTNSAPPGLLLGLIVSRRRGAPRRLTSCYRAAVSKAQTAAVSCSDGAAAGQRRAGDIKTPGWAARHLRHVSCSSITIGCATEHRDAIARHWEPRPAGAAELLCKKKSLGVIGFFIFFVPSKFLFFLFFFFNCQTQCAGVFLCRRVSLDDFGKCEEAAVVTLHYVRQLGAILWSRLISSSNRFIQI